MGKIKELLNHLFNPNLMNISPALVFGISISITIMVLLLMVYKVFFQKKNRFKANIQAMSFVETSKDQLTKWVEVTENRMKKNNLSVQGKKFVLINIVLALMAFALGQYLFQNFIVSILFSAVLFVIPEYFISLLEDNQQKKAEDQLAATMKIYCAEFVQGKPLQKIFLTISHRIGNPVGKHFSDAYFDLVTGASVDDVLSKLSTKFDNHFGKMFVQLIRQSQKDANVIELFPELTNNIEEHIEITRKNESNISVERLQAFILALLPIPAYILMAKAFPETQEFIRQTYYGRLVIILSFISLFVFIIIDRFIRRVE